MTLPALATDNFTPSGDSPPIGLPRLSVVVPCYNEAESLDKLFGELARLREALANEYETELVFVDDGSSDETWNLLAAHFGGDRTVRLVRHEINRGIAAAIETGIREASADIVASLDADCTYEAMQLVGLLAKLTGGVDMVVASPYHPAGKVVGVPGWRLALSRLASRLYGVVMHNKLHTYTSCVRVYRRNAVVDLPVTRGGFVGIVELVWQLDRQGGTIAECPAVLTVRTTGHSKMRVARTAAAHLRLLAQAAWLRLMNWPNSPQPRRIVVSASKESRFSPRTI